MSDNQIIIVTRDSQSLVETPGPSVSVQETVYYASVQENNQQVIVSYGSPGPQGPAGPPGSGASSTIVAGETIPGHRVIVILNNLAYLADPTNTAHALATVGVVRDAATVGNSATYYLSGDLTGGAFSANTDYFVGLGGILTSTPRASGASWMKRIGTAISSTTLVIEMDPTVLI